MRTGLIFDRRMLGHRCLWDDSHIEKPERLERILGTLESRGLVDRCLKLQPRPATIPEISLCHSKQMIWKLSETAGMNDSELEQLSSGYEDVYFCQETFDLALLAAGCAIEAVEAVLEGKCRNSAALIRPPGHHASFQGPCGFCIFNNVAIACRIALEKFGLNRVMIVDWDVHPGQGTQYLFESDPRVLFISIHRYEYGKFWPNLKDTDWDSIGQGDGKGYRVNVPLNAVGFGDAEYLSVFHHLILPLAAEFQPELILVSCGFDAGLGDPEGEMKLTPAAYAHMIRSLGLFAQGRICAVLEGGYFLDFLAEGFAWTLKSLLRDPVPKIDCLHGIHPSFSKVLWSILYVLSNFWTCCDDLLSAMSFSRTSESSLPYEIPGEKYLGSRDVPVPYPTRNLYPARPEEVEKKFRKELETVVNRTSSCNRCKVGFSFNGAGKVGVIYNTSWTGNHFDRCKDSQECPDRLTSALKFLRRQRLAHIYSLMESNRLATEEELLAVHSSEHLCEIRRLVDGWYLESEAEDFPTYGCSKTYDAASAAVGCGLYAVDEVMNDRLESAVALVRPPGHHANVNEVNGFCFLNNVAVAAKYAKRVYGTSKILIVDWDIHFGNGTASIFSEDPTVLCVSVHRFRNFFPGMKTGSCENVGVGEGRGFTINIGWNEGGKNDADYVFVFQHVILPVAYEFSPDLVLICAGFDAGSGDPLGECNLSPMCFGYMSETLSSLANCRTVLFLEGGYNRRNTNEGIYSCLLGLCGEKQSFFFADRAVSADTKEVVSRVFREHRRFWKCFDSLVFLEEQQEGEQAVPMEVKKHESLMKFLGLPQWVAQDADELYAVEPLPFCPHLEQVNPVGENGIRVTDPCFSCGNLGENWICLTCYKVHCGRYVSMHGVMHATEEEHPVVLSFADLSVWCYSCDSYVDHPIIMQAKQAAHVNKFAASFSS